MNDVQAFERRTNDARQSIGRPPVAKYILRPYNHHAGYFFRMFREALKNDKAMWRHLNVIVSNVNEDMRRREHLRQWLEAKRTGTS